MKYSTLSKTCALSLALFIAAMLALTMFAGCSGFQTKTGASTFLDSAASAALAGQNAATPDALAANAHAADNLLAVATYNSFSYIFNGNLAVWVSANFWTNFQQSVAVMDELAKRTLTPPNMALTLQVEYRYFQNWQWQRSALPATNLVSLAKIKAAIPKMVKATPSTDLQNLLNLVPAQFQPWIQQYGPSLLRLGVNDADSLVQLLIKGDTLTPYRAALSQMTEAELVAEEGGVLTAQTQNTNTNAANVAAQKTAASAGLNIIIGIVLSFFGL